jgi:PPM family protein phosphatase
VATTTLRAGSSTDLGRRQVNQDRVLVDDQHSVYAVADGMGGHRGGATAAEMAVAAVSETTVTTSAALVAAVEQANAAIYERSQQDPDLQGMGTTLTAMALIQADGEDRLSIVNVGDSRAYRMRAGELELLTEDHNIVSELVRDGHLTVTEARTHRQRSVLTRAVGVEAGVSVDILEVLPSTGDRYLLCSDGLTGEVDASQIAGIMRRYVDPNEACRDLIRVALASGSKDNISAVIVDVFDDGGIALLASQHVRPDAPTSEPNGVQHQLQVDDPHYEAAPIATPVESVPVVEAVRTSVGTVAPAKRRMLTVRTVLFTALLAGIAAVAYWAIANSPKTDPVAPLDPAPLTQPATTETNATTTVLTTASTTAAGSILIPEDGVPPETITGNATTQG